MKRFSLYFVISIFFISCGGSEPIQQPNTPANNQQQNPQTQTKKEDDKKEENDDELLNLIQKSEEEGKKLDDVEFESIDGKDDKNVTKEDDSKNDVAEKESQKAIKDDPSRKEYIKDDGVAKDNTDELLKQIQSLKSQIKNKDNKINDLNVEKKMLKDENSNLKSTDIQNINVTIQGRISDEEYQSKYDEAYSLLQNKSFDVSISIFESLIVSNSSHSLADNAQYWIGEAHFAQRKYKQAILDFEKVFTFAKSNKNEDAQFKIGLCYYLVKDNENARIEMNRFISKFPNSRNVTRANQILNKI